MSLQMLEIFSEDMKILFNLFNVEESNYEHLPVG